MAHPILDIYHRIYITGLMLFKPATLFHKINSLPWYQRTLHQWFASLQCSAGSSILEVGCATGQLTEYIGRQGMNVVGVDYSSRMLKLAENSVSSNVRFESANALNLPFEDNQFDHVIAGSLLNILVQPERVLGEMLRVCKPGGKVSVLVPMAGMTSLAVKGLANELRLSGFSHAALMTWHNRAPKMQRSALTGYFENAGLSRLEEQTYLQGLVITMTGIK